jgi:hypothetical protein
MRHPLAFGVAVFLLVGATASAQQQLADPNFKTTVERPAYPRSHPTVVIDEAHDNFHTADGRYRPFADLLTSDGYEVVRGTRKFAKGSLRGVSVLVIANAGNSAAATDKGAPPAFTDEECDAVRDWVRGGGALLLIADHTPFGAAAETMGKRFGVDMGKGFAYDPDHSEDNPSILVFSRDNGLLGDHPITRGREPGEEVKRVVAFTGQSLGVPAGATILMKLGPAAYEAPGRGEMQEALANKSGPGTHAVPVSGRAQGLAFRLGKGRVVVMGEAAMFSAQVVRFNDEDGKPQEFQMGMNIPGNDDKQLALNLMRWLSGLLK